MSPDYLHESVVVTNAMHRSKRSSVYFMDFPGNFLVAFRGTRGATIRAVNFLGGPLQGEM